MKTIITAILTSLISVSAFAEVCDNWRDGLLSEEREQTVQQLNMGLGAYYTNKANPSIDPQTMDSAKGSPYYCTQKLIEETIQDLTRKTATKQSVTFANNSIFPWSEIVKDAQYIKETICWHIVRAKNNFTLIKEYERLDSTWQIRREPLQEQIDLEDLKLGLLETNLRQNQTFMHFRPNMSIEFRNQCNCSSEELRPIVFQHLQDAHDYLNCNE